jgi:hypothetical protein
MSRSGIAEESPVIGSGAILANGTETFIQGTAPAVWAGDPAVGMDGGRAPLQSPTPGNAGDVNLTLTPLQRVIEELLDPRALHKRPVKEWRSLYRSFFAFFGPNGGANETERKAWAIAAAVFNTNLVAVCNRTTQVVPMTFQDFVDGVDSFRHEGLREGAQRDIAWQPKKILLLMAAMVGRIVAGWQADVGLTCQSHQDLFPFRNYLIAENRKASFLGSVFDYDPRFSILEYQAGGLKPLLHAFPHFADALMENGIDRCEFCAAQIAGNPPLLRAHFLRPLRVPIPLRTISTLNLVLLHKSLPLTAGSHPSTMESSYFAFSRTALEALAFEPTEAPEIKCSKFERLFELAITDGLLICAPQRADTSTATRIGKTLGRTQAEQFVIERFFALGFRNGHGNEPWLEQPAREPPQLDPNKVKKARKQFGHWKDTSLFFLLAGQPQAADIPGATIRHEALHPKGPDVFLSLLNTPVYAPLMGVFLAADAQAKWLVNEPELHAFARSLNGTTGRVLLETGGAITRYADSFNDQETKSVFLFECAVGILLSATGEHKNPRRLASLERAKDALRKDHERLFAVSLSAAPSVQRANPVESAAQLVETRKRFEEAEQTIMKLLGEPLSRKVSEQLRVTLAGLLNQTSSLAGQTAPRIRLEDKTAFEKSIASLCAWIRSIRNPAPSGSLPGAGQLLATLVELRVFAEEGNAAEALEKASVLYPTLSKAEKQALAPFFGELSWSFIQAIEEQLDRGNHEKAAALAESATVITEGTRSRDEFKSLLLELFAPKPANKGFTPLGPSPAASAPEASGLSGPRAHQAEVLLRDHADELSMAVNQLEQEFLKAVWEGSDAAFKRKAKLRNRLQRRTQWGGREPYKTTLKLLESITECNT